MMTIGEVNELLDELAAGLPEEIFRELNGGVNLLPEAKRNNADADGKLYTLGEYRRDQMGRYIVIYYGSLCSVYGGASHKKMRGYLKDVLTHELTHHLESLAGERDLEIEDEIRLDRYLNS